MLNATFKGEEAVIQEVEEENTPEDGEDPQRHSLLKNHETEENFNKEGKIETNDSQANLEVMNQTSQQVLSPDNVQQ